MKNPQKSGKFIVTVPSIYKSEQAWPFGDLRMARHWATWLFGIAHHKGATVPLPTHLPCLPLCGPTTAPLPTETLYTQRVPRRSLIRTRTRALHLLPAILILP